MSGAGSERAREEVAAACRRLAAEGLVRGTSGNVSARVADDRFAVTVVGPDGAVAEGELAATSEVFLHLGVYERYGAGAVVHTHSPVGTALSTVLDELPCIHYEMLALGGPIRVAPYRTFGTPELAEAVLEALEGRAAALMANHGAIVHGDSLEQAVERALLLEWACTVYWRAAAIGEPRVLGPDDLGAVGEAVAQRGYGSTRPR
jgi:L-fuculose-phosphate aldolase